MRIRRRGLHYLIIALPSRTPLCSNGFQSASRHRESERAGVTEAGAGCAVSVGTVRVFTMAAHLPRALPRREFLAAAGSVGVAIAALGWTRPASALPNLKMSSLMLPLSGTAFYPPEPTFNLPGEAVTLAGGVHVITAWPPQPGISDAKALRLLTAGSQPRARL